MNNNKITRRVFLSESCRKASCVIIAALAGTTIGGCGIGSNMETVKAPVVNGAITLPLDASSHLSEPGNAVFIEHPVIPIVVVHVSSDVFTAVAGMCTHEACKISRYDAFMRRFHCPCHNGYFDTTGEPVAGPVRRPLKSYETRIEEETLVIRVM